MNLRFGELSRGSGKIFLRFEIEDEPQDVLIQASSKSAEGNDLPAVCIDVPKVSGHVLMLTIVSVAQTATISVHDNQTGKIQSFSKVIKPFSARLHSSVNTALKNNRAELIRNSDFKVRPQGIYTDIGDVIFDAPRHQDVVHGFVHLLSASSDESATNIELSILDQRGRNAAMGDIIILGDTLKPDTEYPGVYRREITFSFRIDHGLPSFTIWARNSSDVLNDGFCHVEDFRLRAHRQGWLIHTEPANLNTNYERWYNDHQRAHQRELELQRGVVLKEQPLFSIIVPLYKTPISYFNEMVESVLAQSYTKFELIFVNASPEDQNLAAAVKSYVDADERLRCINVQENLGITENTNVGIKAATGDFLCFLDHDDIIEADLLFEYARAISKDPSCDLLYCDEDKLTDDELHTPFFKPDWSPDLLCANNYVCHLLCVRKAIVDELELPTKEFDGAQDQHMTLRVAEKARTIYHVRKVLYHWRIHEGSTAAAPDTKSYTSLAGVRAVQAHLDRCHIPGTVVADKKIPNVYRIDYHLEHEPLVSIVIPNKDMVDVLDRCLKSIDQKTNYKNIEVIVVENNSTDAATFDYYKKAQERYSWLRVIEEPKTDGRFNFSRTVNYGVKASHGELVLLLNNDIEVIDSEWLTRMVGPCLREDVGIVGAKLLYPDGLIQHAGVSFHKMGPTHLGLLLPSTTTNYYNLFNLTLNVTAVTGACLLTKRSIYEELGGLDEVNFEVDYNDIDFCCRVRELGYLVVYEPRATLYHYESVSRGIKKSGEAELRFTREQGRMMQRWPRYYAEGDPYMSPSFKVSGMYRSLDF